MNNYNCICRLTRDPELKFTQSGMAVSNFSIAVKGFKKDEAYFFNCQAWGKTAETIAEYVKKGDQLGIGGELQQQRWEDDAGKKRDKVIINVGKITFIGGKKKDLAEDMAKAVSGEVQDEPDAFPF